MRGGTCTFAVLFLLSLLFGCGNGGGSSADGSHNSSNDGNDTSSSRGSGNGTGGQITTVCSPGISAGDVQRPVFVRNLPGRTGRFASPVVVDLDGDGQLEILVQTFDHGLDIFTVPGSGCKGMIWTTARG